MREPETYSEPPRPAMSRLIAFYLGAGVGILFGIWYQTQVWLAAATLILLSTFYIALGVFQTYANNRHRMKRSIERELAETHWGFDFYEE